MTGDHFILPLKSRERIGKYLVFSLDTSGSDFAFRAGKYVTLTLDREDGNGKISRIFSIASSPLDSGRIRFATIYRDGSDFKNRLQQYSPGDLIEVSGPLGGFLPISNIAKPLIFVSSEIGVTPVISIVRHAVETERRQKMHLFYLNRSSDDEIFMDEFHDTAERTEDFSMTGILSDDLDTELRTLFTRDKIGEHCPEMDYGSAVWYISGKPIFVYNVRKILQASEFSGSTIKTEKFSGY